MQRKKRDNALVERVFRKGTAREGERKIDREKRKAVTKFNERKSDLHSVPLFPLPFFPASLPNRVRFSRARTR